MSNSSKSGKPNILPILITLFIDSLGFGIIIPVVPALLKELSGIDSDSHAAWIAGFLMFAYAVVQFFCGPIAGGLSDKYGRRPVLLGSLFGFAVDYLISALAGSIFWLFIARIFAGMMGASFSTGAAYISDVSSAEDRPKNFGLIGVAFGLGFIFGPFIGGWMGTYGLRVPFLAAGAFAFLNLIYSFFLMPESLKKENRREFDWKRANPFGTFKIMFANPLIRPLFISLSLVYIAAHAVQSNWAFFTGEKFGWGPKEVGYSLGVVGVVFAIVQGGLIRIIIPKLGQSKSVYVGLGLYAAGLFLYAFAPQPWMIFAVTVVYCLGGIAGPAMQGIMAGAVPPNAQGELQGGFTSMMSLTSIVAPLLLNSFLFAWFTGDSAPIYFPGVAMLVGAILCVGATIIARNFLKKPLPKPQTAATT